MKLYKPRGSFLRRESATTWNACTRLEERLAQNPEDAAVRKAAEDAALRWIAASAAAGREAMRRS
jgi:hypothetical protein